MRPPGRVVADPTADLFAPIERCQVGPGRCPEPPDFVVVCTNAVGFMPACSRHTKQFCLDHPHATVVIVPLADFVAQWREYLDPAHPGRLL